MKKIVIINGPNLNLLGEREPEIYGGETMETRLDSLRHLTGETPIEYFQSNSEGEIIDLIHGHGRDNDVKGIVINPGAYSHYSLAIADAIRSVPAKIIEVHISNIHAREEFRQKSVTATACSGVITGFGMDGYDLAVSYLLKL